MTEVIVTDQFNAWFQSLEVKDAEAVVYSVGLLEALGATLPYPHSSRIEGSKYAMRELRVQSQGEPVRIFYMFDPHRQAVLLIGGGKGGDDRFYGRMIPIAEKLWEVYLEEFKTENQT